MYYIDKITSETKSKCYGKIYTKIAIPDANTNFNGIFVLIINN